MKKQIVMFGGCFNPPLNSHFSLADQLANEYKEIEKIIFVPANSKYQKIGLISNEHRFQMLKLVCDNNPNFLVSRIELDSIRPLYTIETLHRLQKEYIEYEIAFLIGSDNLKELHTWKRAEELVTKFKIYVHQRNQEDRKEIIQKNPFLKQMEKAFILPQNSITSNLSSTFVRKQLQEGKSVRYLTPDEVIYYMKENNLYQQIGRDEC